MPVIIRQLQNGEQSSWDAYVDGHHQGSFFHLIGWKTVIEKSFSHKPYYLIAVEHNEPIDTNQYTSAQSNSDVHQTNNKTIQYSDHIKTPGSLTQKLADTIVGILPLFSIRSFLFGKFLISIPFAENGGALADSDEIENLLIKKAIEITKTQCLDFLELRYKDKIINGLILKKLYYNFKREIFNDIDQNLKAIPRKSRRMIRQGEKFNLSYQFGNQNLKLFYRVLTKSYHNLGTPCFAYNFFENICREFEQKCILLIIQNQNKLPVAGVLSFLFKDQILPYYAGSLVEYRNMAPNDFMYWQLMEYGCKNGYKYFDFGRSKEGTGSFHFKKHWGFEPAPLHYQYYLNKVNEMPNISPANPKYKKKIELWKRMPYWAISLMGPTIAKYLA